MVRYDKHGVTIAAPLQGSDAALTAKRYGDKYRGPAVPDSYELSHCRIDLAERSQRWPSPSDDQRDEFLRRQANYDEVNHLISRAIRTGELPIWVAPIGQQEQRVAIEALATIDERSIVGGVFCPISEEHKSDDERPWLWERPLFVKRNDWTLFANSVDWTKAFETKALHFRHGSTFNCNEPANITPWWSINQSLAWIATRIPSLVEYIGNLEGEEPREPAPYIVQSICEYQITENDDGKAFIESRRSNWPEGTALAHAGRDLLASILSGEVSPFTSENGHRRLMHIAEFVGIGSNVSASDWLDLVPQPIFSSAEVMRIFAVNHAVSASEGSPIETTAGAEARCRTWLMSAFKNDPGNKRNKESFKAEALEYFDGRLSERAFLRAWSSLAPLDGRTRPGRKS